MSVASRAVQEEVITSDLFHRESAMEDRREPWIRKDEKGVKILRFPASSEQPVERWFGTEILSHATSAVDLERANSGAMPLLFNHNVDDPIGMIRSAEIKKARLWVEATLFDTPRAAEVAAMIDGGLRNVSIAYRVGVLEEDTKQEIFTATEWEPFEVSIVSVPADPSVGIGRKEGPYEVRMVRASAQQPAASAETREDKMEKQSMPAGAARAANTVDDQPEDKLTARQQEERRQKAIRNLCKANGLDETFEQMFISRGYSLETVSDEILSIFEERGKHNPNPVSKVGLSEREIKRFSIARAIEAVCSGNWSQAGLEAEVSRTIGNKFHKAPDPRKLYVPFEVLERPIERAEGRRDMTVGTDAAGGYLRDTANMGFIELLYARAVILRMGARRLSGLVGNVTIPRMSAGGTAYWVVGEAQAVTESQQTLQQVALAPKNCAAYTEISRQLLIQSNPGAEGIVSDDLAKQVALAVDAAGLAGTGSPQPQGIIGASGVGTVAAGSLNYAGVLEGQTDVASANVIPLRGGYVTTPAVAAIAKQRVKFSNTASPLWEGNIFDGTMEGFPAMSSNQVPTAKMIFGDWAELVLAEWGVLELDVNPFANFQAGIVGVRAWYSIDIGIRRPGAFSTYDTIT